jgi:transposase
VAAYRRCTKTRPARHAAGRHRHPHRLLPQRRAGPDPLIALPGVGPESAGQLLTTTGDNPDRLRSEASFAHLCGAAPLSASSGRTNRHRLNRGGDRQANRALHTIVLVRMRSDQRTREYVARRTAEGMTKKDIMRCLKRFVAREVYQHLPRPHITTEQLAQAS